MTQDFAKPTTTRKPGAQKAKSAQPGDKRAPARKTKTAKAVNSKGPKISKGATSTKIPKTEPTKPKRAKFILSLIILIGAFIYGLYFLQTIPPTQSEDEINTRQKQLLQTDKKHNKEKTLPENRFSFYDILPDSKVIPPKVDAYQFKEKNSQDNFHYLIQTGSFRHAEDAERQKATIAFQGLKAKIKIITSDNGRKWHRVMTGPYNNRSTMNSALDKLVAINIQPLVKKTKKDP